MLLLFAAFPVSGQKTVFIPASMKNMDLNSTSSQWCTARSKQTDNVVLFWESGFGSNPSTASGSYRVDIDKLLSVAEKSYTTYLDTLKFAIKGSSVTDKYKLMISLLYSTEWAAYGSGQDNMVGSLQVNPAAANIGNVVAHEIGHCFEYITGCDSQGGYQYGFGENGSGGNGFWEQCAQWMAWNVYPGQQFTEADFQNYLNSHHKHILHETPRYANYFIQEYWTYKHDITFLGRLWRDSKKPEDPVETYQRLNSLTQEQFNDEIYEQAAHLTTWDLPRIVSYGAKYIDSRKQVTMSLTTDKYWLVASPVCPENYGYNSIKLNAPVNSTEVTVRFKGVTGASGFRKLNPEKGGWRFGFVALLKDGERAYSSAGQARTMGSSNPDTALTFTCPANCSKLWLVVSGAPQEHWKHAWDDNDNNDEQWPYQVQFTNTNLLGQATGMVAPVRNVSLQHRAPQIRSNMLYLPENGRWQIANLLGQRLVFGIGNLVDITQLPSGGYVASFEGSNYSFVKK